MPALLSRLLLQLDEAATAPHAHLCAAALPDHSVALYDLTLREWSPHKLANTQQRE